MQDKWSTNLSSMPDYSSAVSNAITAEEMMMTLEASLKRKQERCTSGLHWRCLSTVAKAAMGDYLRVSTMLHPNNSNGA